MFWKLSNCSFSLGWINFNFELLKFISFYLHNRKKKQKYLFHGILPFFKDPNDFVVEETSVHLQSPNSSIRTSLHCFIQHIGEWAINSSAFKILQSCPTKIFYSKNHVESAHLWKFRHVLVQLNYNRKANYTVLIFFVTECYSLYYC